MSVDVCGKCGAEIPVSNLPHVCVMRPGVGDWNAWAKRNEPRPWSTNVPADLRAAEALERCADALDRIAKTLEEG